MFYAVLNTEADGKNLRVYNHIAGKEDVIENYISKKGLQLFYIEDWNPKSSK
jgi:cellobiose phosphorylase